MMPLPRNTSLRRKGNLQLGVSLSDIARSCFKGEKEIIIITITTTAKEKK